MALAAGMLSIADGSDMMGSLRNPAGWNNVYGFRPTWGRVHLDAVGDTWLHRISTPGPMARNVEDLLALLGTLSEPDPRWPGAPWPEITGSLDPDLQGKRIATSYPHTVREFLREQGVEADLHEVLVEAIGDKTWVRFRLLAPEIDRDRAEAPGFGDRRKAMLRDIAILTGGTVVSEITRIDRNAALPPNAFAIPAGYRVQDVITAAGFLRARRAARWIAFRRVAPPTDRRGFSWPTPWRSRRRLPMVSTG